MKEKILLQGFDNSLVMALCGINEGNLHMLEQVYDVNILLRGDEITISGESNVKDVAEIINTMVNLLKSHSVNEVTKRDINYAINLKNSNQLNKVEDLYHIKIAKTYSGKLIYPKTAGQKYYYNSLQKNDVVFGVGPAGTGKTYLAVVFAVTALKANKVKRIILTRPAVEAGENLGFLPGDLKEKVDPYLRPLYDALYDMLGIEQTDKLIEKGIIEIAPLAYMRGRTLDDAYVILDEAQNTTPNQMKMFLTRLGFNSKMIITGDQTQIDLPKGQKSGLKDALHILKGTEGIAFVYLTAIDVVRHPVVQSIIEKYENS